MPRPPPPALALRMIGKPMRSAAARSSSSLWMPAEPGSVGTPAAAMAARALILSPMRRIAAGGGPIQLRPHLMQTSANSAFSERKP